MTTTYLENRLTRPCALSCLRKLKRDGCPEEEIRICLTILEMSTSRDDWQNFAGMNRQKLKRMIERIKDLADLIEKTNSTLLVGLPTLIGSTEVTGFYQIPALLRHYAFAIDARRSVSGPKRRPSLNAAIAHLLATVLARTGRPHYSEVGELLHVILGPTWNPDSLKTWRAEHADLLEAARLALHKTLPTYSQK